MSESRERTDLFAEQGGYAYRKFQLSCIREGNSTLLKELLAQPDYRGHMRDIFCDDPPAAFHALSFVAAQAWAVAVDSGVPEKEADQVCDQFLRSAGSSFSVPQIIKQYDRLLISMADAVGRRRNQGRGSPRIQSIRNYILEHLEEKITIEQIADSMHISANYLSHSFREKFGVPLSTYILNERIQWAKLLLLQPDLSVAQVMEKLGFVSQSHFTKAFRDSTGLTPGKYQAQAQKGNDDAVLTVKKRSPDPKQDWYAKAEQYGYEKGLKQQKLHFHYIATGNVIALKDYFYSEDYVLDTQLMLGQEIRRVQEVFICLWPQAAHTAVDAGMEIGISSSFLQNYLDRLYACESITEILSLNQNFFVQLAIEMAELHQNHSI